MNRISGTYFIQSSLFFTTYQYEARVDQAKRSGASDTGRTVYNRWSYVRIQSSWLSYVNEKAQKSCRAPRYTEIRPRRIVKVQNVSAFLALHVR